MLACFFTSRLRQPSVQLIASSLCVCVCVFPTDAGAAAAPGAPHRPHARPVHPHTVTEALPIEGAHAAGCAPQGVIVQQRSGGSCCCSCQPLCRVSVCYTVLAATRCSVVPTRRGKLHLASQLQRVKALLRSLSRAVCAGHAGQTILRQGQEVSDIHFVMHGSVHLTYSAALTQTAARAAARNLSGGGLPPGAARLSSGGWPAAAAADGTDGGPRASSAGRFSGLALALKLEQSCFDPAVVLATRCVACRAQVGSVPQRPRGCWPTRVVAGVVVHTTWQQE